MRSDCARPSPTSEAPLRLNRYLAQCGEGSRRACDRLIADGRVSVDGTPVTSMGLRVFPLRQTVAVDGRVVRPEPTRVLMLHKPRNTICTVTDPGERRTILDLLPPEQRQGRLYPVGRLDFNSEGLILVTNDGDLANRLTHPRHHVEKEYLVWTREPLTEGQQKDMLRGVRDNGEQLSALRIAEVPSKGRYHCCAMVLGEGRNRHIRRMCETAGVSVVRIQRVRVGGLGLGDLPVGSCRALTPGDLAALERPAPRTRRRKA